MSDSQYQHAVADLLPGVVVPEIQTPGRDRLAFVSYADQFPIDGSMTSILRQASKDVAAQVEQHLATLVPCPNADLAACATSFIDAFAPRAFRRPLDTAERTNLLALYQLGATEAGQVEGIKRVVEAVLQSPSFLYRSELGTPNVAGTTPLGPFETASALSFFLLDSIPDAELWSAAEARSLSTLPSLTAQVDRLLALPRVRQHLTEVLLGWLGAPAILSIEPNGITLTDEQRSSMLAETRAFLDATLWQHGSVQDLLTSPKAFLDVTSAALYGLPGVTGEVTLPAAERAGILTRAAIIGSIGGGSRIVHRGKFVRRELLCGELSPPPPGINIKPPESEGLSERQFMDLRAQSATCGGCHALMDPLGLAFENYDRLGQFVSQSETGAVDASGVLSGTDVDGPYQNAVELSRLLSGSEQVRACLAKKMLTYALGRGVEEGDQCSQTRVLEQMQASSNQLSSVFRAIAIDEVLRTRKWEN